MKKINIEASKMTPSVFIDIDNGIFEMEGRSLHESPNELFNTILKALKDYESLKNKKPIKFIFDFEFVNTASTRKLYQILNVIKNFEGNIKWYYEYDDESIQDLGEFFKEMISDGSIDFDIIGKPEE